MSHALKNSFPKLDGVCALGFGFPGSLRGFPGFPGSLRGTPGSLRGSLGPLGPLGPRVPWDPLGSLPWFLRVQDMLGLKVFEGIGHPWVKGF